MRFGWRRASAFRATTARNPASARSISGKKNGTGRIAMEGGTGQSFSRVGGERGDLGLQPVQFLSGESRGQGPAAVQIQDEAAGGEWTVDAGGGGILYRGE